MSTEPHIHYLTRQEVDIARWDDCICRSANRLIYGLHFHLDHMTGGQWNALVSGDYEAVMPLTWRRKYGVTYLAQPAFTQQTGIFSPSRVTPQTIDAFLSAASAHYRFAEIFLNYGNPGSALEARINLLLSLDKPYDTLYAEYSDNHRRNLRKTTGLVYTLNIARTEALNAWRTLHGGKNLATLGDEEYRRFDTLCQSMERENNLLLRAALDAGDQYLAIALLFRDASRLYLLQFTTLPQGRDMAASHFLIDRLIREFAGQPLQLDFEGSDDPGVARFYSGFGAAGQPYFFWRHNRLPWPARLFKGPVSGVPPPAQDPPE